MEAENTGEDTADSCSELQSVRIRDCDVVTCSYGVGSRYQTTGEDTTDWEDSVRAVANCRV
jgi:hypothetical protein